MYHLFNYAKTFKYIKSSIFRLFEHFRVKKVLSEVDFLPIGNYASSM